MTDAVIAVPASTAPAAAAPAAETVATTPATEQSVDTTTTAAPAEQPELTEREKAALARAEAAEKAAKKLERRVGRLTAKHYQTAAELEHSRRAPPADESEDARDQRQLQEHISTAARQQVEAERFTAKCNDVFDAGTKADPKFGDAFKAVSDEVGGLMTPKGGSTPLLDAILDSDQPHKLISHLAENPDLAAELADMSPVRQLKRLGQIEKEMAAPKSTPEPSAAAKPVKPVTPAAPSGAPDAKKDPAAWIAWRNKQGR
jgi:hypothetical protein